MKFVQTLRDLLHQHTGPLTRELARTQGILGLGQVPSRLAPDSTVISVCGYCSTGCALEVHLQDGKPVNLSPARSYPVNRGVACPKGWEALAPLYAADRATTPLLRRANGEFESLGWSNATALFVDRFKAIQAAHGSESVAFLSTGQIPTEEMALLGALTKFGMGWLHGDGNTRQCMATAVVAHKQAFGFDAPPYAYADLEASDVIVLVGSNICITHPILWERIARNPHDPAIIVIDPRRSETAMAATTHYALEPKSDLTLFYSIANELIRIGQIDKSFIEAHTEDFEAFRDHVAPFTLGRAAAATGLSAERVAELARTLADGARVSFWWTMGVNQSHEGVAVAQSLINLALMTGNIGRPGTGANSITGQCNAMGSRLFSNTTSLFGGRDFESATDRDEVASILDLAVEQIPSKNSLAYDQIIEQIIAGQIRGLWIIGTNPAHSWINQNDLREALGRLDFLVVQDMYASTETARMADLVLPAAGWGEKEGTFINSERRIARTRRFTDPPGQALTDFEIFHAIARAWGCEEIFQKWQSPEEVFQLLKQLSRGLPCDFSGIQSYAALDVAGGIQWPMTQHGDAFFEQRRLFEDGEFFRPSGRARFCFAMPRAPRELPSERYPFVLLTGRGSASQWHTQTRTSKSSVLKKLYPDASYAEINPKDARRLGIQPNDWIVVRSQRGRATVRAFVTMTVRPGQIFMPMHASDTNRLTLAVFDPQSRQPSYKHCAVDVTPKRA